MHNKFKLLHLFQFGMSMCQRDFSSNSISSSTTSVIQYTNVTHRVCKKAGQLYKSPLRWLKLDKTGLNWTFLDKIGLFQNYFNFSTKTHSKCLKWHLNTEPNIYFGKYNIYWSSQAKLLAFFFGKIDFWNKIDINLLSE